MTNNRLLKQIIIYFSIAFVLAWGTWIPAFRNPTSLRLLSFIGLFAPAISAIIVAFSFDRTFGVKELLRRYTRFHFGLFWYMTVLLFIPILFILSFLIDGLLFHSSFKNIFLPVTPQFVIGAFLWLMFLNSGEEIGWRGFALPRLQRLLKNPITPTVILGVLWSTWHLPLYLNPGQSSFPVVLFFIFTIGISFIYTVVFNKTRGSLLAVVMLHASTDIMPRVLNISLFRPSTWFILGIITWLSAASFFFIFRKKAALL